jgi:hypothetical protein
MATYVAEALNDPTLYFETLIWTGDGNTPRSLSGLDFQPDMVWSKRRDDAAGHNVLDAVRGAGVDKEIQTNGTGAEGSGRVDEFGYMSAFTSDGFTVTAGSSDNAYWNNNTATYVAWCWKESADAGFDIVSWTGNGSSQNISHSLSAVPHFMITKNRSATGDWSTYHKYGGGTKTFYLSNTDAIGTTSSPWNDTTPTSSVFSVGGGAYTNGDGNSIIGYLWTEKQGYSKFGSYTGNGSGTDGIFVYTGFKPAWLLVKQSSASGEGWYMWDNKRSSSGGHNENDRYLIASASNAEGTLGVDCDFLSNGFKHYYSGDASNGSSDTYIYMAFAEAPFVNSNGVPCNAR